MIPAEVEAVARSLRCVTVQIRAGRDCAGCGIVWHSNGLIVSNAHVARGTWLEIELESGEELQGRTIWKDPRRDLAAIAVPAMGLPEPVLGDVSELRPGQIVLALGHPYGSANAVSMGVIHQVAAKPSRDRWLKADIRLAPGNSGGPLADVAGRVIGINTLIAGGLAHAVPITAVQRFVCEIADLAA
jgi:serine protease Do